MARNPEIQISIDHLVVNRDGTSTEARDIVISASGVNGYEAAAAAHTQLATLLGLPQEASEDG